MRLGAFFFILYRHSISIFEVFISDDGPTHKQPDFGYFYGQYLLGVFPTVGMTVYLFIDFSQFTASRAETYR